MGCTNSKVNSELIQNHNLGFDLLDSDGNHKISPEEIENIASFFHKHMVEVSQNAHNTLESTEPMKYLYNVIGKKENTSLVRKDFNKIAYMIPLEKWKTQLVPLLQNVELARLTNLKQY